MLDRIRTLPAGARSTFVWALGLLLLGATFALPPLAQNQAYHDFADKRAWLGIPNFGDVASNLGFAVVGVLGLACLLGDRGRTLFPDRRAALPWIVFFAGAALIAAGSAWYHLAPRDGTLFWDRLAMTVAFMSLVAAFVADRIDLRLGVAYLLPGLLAFGVVSVWVWAASDDLRLYALTKAFPILGIPILCALFPGRVTRFRFALEALLLFALASLFEALDTEVFAALGGAVSGHTLKHLVGAAAVWRFLAMLRRAKAGAP